MPRGWAVEGPAGPHLSRGVRQRVGKRRAKAAAANEALSALNQCALGRRSSKEMFGTSEKLNASQDAVKTRVWEAVAESPPQGREFTPQAALSALLQSESRYEEGAGGGLASFGSGPVSLPGGQSRAAPLAELLDSEAREEVAAPERRMLLSAEELEGELERRMPNLHHDPAFERCPRRYALFIRDLYSSGVVRFSREVKVVNGIFFVKKKNGKLRLMLDARRASVFFKNPPSRNNASASCLALPLRTTAFTSASLKRPPTTMLVLSLPT